MTTTNVKTYIFNYIKDVIEGRVKSYIKEELERIEKAKQDQIDDLKRNLPLQVEKIAAEVSIETQLMESLDEFTKQLKITIISK